MSATSQSGQGQEIQNMAKSGDVNLYWCSPFQILRIPCDYAYKSAAAAAFITHHLAICSSDQSEVYLARCLLSDRAMFVLVVDATQSIPMLTDLARPSTQPAAGHVQPQLAHRSLPVLRWR